ncbi:MAG: type I-E CRISPR-associated protein Cas6/Cse3/CasE [gamma proteobacterium endosymbiont of Lamellibrachia anaximandri]|nr:type I-E CRISPR-associated protein Cas6/Cse3/CasE [gamma proteobacterium endosymbiont of Lamellibrachia anaximandri]MBL3533840.1 type I-E CRISPR-associated protein Cas6/Cse3/CasE [gamma proteobacterium endosymbiont of Lamellibrachia anaximandri]
MYFSRIRLRTDTDTRKLAQQLCQQSSYSEHQQLWRLFDDNPEAKRDFLFRRNDNDGWPQFYLLSNRQPVDRSGVWQIDQRDYRPQLQTGQLLAFSLRANPVVTRKNVRNGKRQRHDLVMDIKTKTGWRKQSPAKRPHQAAIWQQAGKQWLEPRLERTGAQLNSITAEHYQQHKESKRNQKAAISYSSLDLSGTLTITDPESFLTLLTQGIGPAKGLGCGLLLIRRI